MSDERILIVRVCEGCHSWTDEPCTVDECVDKYGWVFEDESDAEGPGRSWYCPECQ